MGKLIVLFFGSFWLSCGNTPETAQNKTTVPEKKTESVQPELTDSISSDEIDNGVTPIPETEKPVEKTEMSQRLGEPSKSAPIVRETFSADKKMGILPDHSPWNTLLAKYVNSKGDVNYKGFQLDIEALENYLNHLAEKSPEKDWSKNEKLAYYINLYNAATVKLILDNYPVRSIKDIKNPWGKDWIKTGDGELSLGDIEHKILRKMNEPRIHFAINCAAFSCPKLLNEAFTPNQMEAQLQEVAMDFLNDPARNILSEEKIQLSNIFKWYKKDFTENGSLVDYIKPYTEIEINNDTDIDYLKYDWNLNEAK